MKQALIKHLLNNDNKDTFFLLSRLYSIFNGFSLIIAALISGAFLLLLPVGTFTEIGIIVLLIVVSFGLVGGIGALFLNSNKYFDSNWNVFLFIFKNKPSMIINYFFYHFLFLLYQFKELFFGNIIVNIVTRNLDDADFNEQFMIYLFKDYSIEKLVKLNEETPLNEFSYLITSYIDNHQRYKTHSDFNEIKKLLTNSEIIQSSSYFQYSYQFNEFIEVLKKQEKMILKNNIDNFI